VVDVIVHRVMNRSDEVVARFVRAAKFTTQPTNASAIAYAFIITSE